MAERGGQTIFTQELADDLCERLKTGRTLRDVCRDEGMPAASTVLLWCEENRAFDEQYARAREKGYRTMADEILDISDDASKDWLEANGHKSFNGEHVQRSRLRVDTRKWLLSKALPKIYGDKVELSGPEGGPLVIKWAEPAADDASQQSSPQSSKKL